MKIKSSLWLPFVFCCALAFMAIGFRPAEAQVLYGAVVGTVADATGAVVPRAPVSIVNQGTGETRQGSTNSLGAYNFANVSPGIYDLKVAAPGFRAFTSTGVSVTINSISRVDVALELGQTTESVTVAAAAATLQTDRADLRTELGSKEVAELPLPAYRNYQALLNLVAGATPGRIDTTALGSPMRPIAHNVNGTPTSNNNNRVDGAFNTRAHQPNQVIYVPPAESIETVNIATNSFDAEQGFAGGATVTVTTKSGTNEFHGVLFHNLRNSIFNAREFFYVGERNPKSIVNMYGGTLGGPIKRDKLFFFLSYEALRERELQWDLHHSHGGAARGKLRRPRGYDL